MKKFDGILICSDVDGTLLKTDKSLSAENLEAIEYFKQNGGKFTIMTGRMPFALHTVLDIITPNAPLGFGNGLGLYDVASGKMPLSNSLGISALPIARYIYDNFPDIGIEYTTYDEILCARVTETVVRHLDHEKLPLKTISIDGFKGDLAKILFAAESEKIDSLTSVLPNLECTSPFQLIRSDAVYYEVLPKDMTKGTLVLKLSEILGIDIKNVIAIGDNENDVSMLKAAGTGIAVGNATESAKTAADIVTVSNEENAIAKIIYDL